MQVLGFTSDISLTMLPVEARQTFACCQGESTQLPIRQSPNRRELTTSGSHLYPFRTEWENPHVCFISQAYKTNPLQGHIEPPDYYLAKLLDFDQDVAPECRLLVV